MPENIQATLTALPGRSSRARLGEVAAIEIFRLFGRIFIDDKEARESIAKTEGRAESLGSRLGNIIGVAAKAGAALVGAATGAFVAFERMGAGFDDAFDTIAVGTGATGEALEGLQEDFKAVFGSIPTEMGPAASAIADLNTLTGATGESLQNMARSVLEASRLLGEDGAANAKAFGQSLQQWQIPAEQAPLLMDQLFKVTQDYGISLSDLISQMNKFSPVLQNAGFSADESAEFFGRLNAAGIQVSRVMPGLNAAFRRWAAEGKNVASEFDDVIRAVRDAETNTEALTIATEAFGAQGAQRLMTAIRSGALPTLDFLVESVDDAEGSIAAAAAATEDWPEKWERFRNRAMVALEPVATAVFGLAGDLMDRLGPALESTAEWAAENMPKIAGFFQNAFEVIGGAVDWLVDNVIEPLRRTFAGSMDHAGGSVQMFQATVVPTLQAVGEVIRRFVELVMAWWSRWGDTIISIVTTAFTTLHRVIQSVLGIITGILDVFIGLFTGDWERMADGLKAIWQNLWEGIRAIVAGAWNILKTAFGGLWDSIAGWFSRLWESFRSWGSDLIAGLWQGIQEAWERLKARVTGLFSGIGDTVKRVLGISSPSRVFAEIGQDIMRGLQAGIERMSPMVNATVAANVLPAPAGAMALPVARPTVSTPPAEPIAHITINRLEVHADGLRTVQDVERFLLTIQQIARQGAIA